MGTQKLKPRKRSVAASQAPSRTPMSFSVATNVASKTPSTPGATPSVRAQRREHEACENRHGIYGYAESPEHGPERPGVERHDCKLEAGALSNQGTVVGNARGGLLQCSQRWAEERQPFEPTRQTPAAAHPKKGCGIAVCPNDAESCSQSQTVGGVIAHEVNDYGCHNATARHAPSAQSTDYEQGAAQASAGDSLVQ